MTKFKNQACIEGYVYPLIEIQPDQPYLVRHDHTRNVVRLPDFSIPILHEQKRFAVDIFEGAEAGRLVGAADIYFRTLESEYKRYNKPVVHTLMPAGIIRDGRAVGNTTRQANWAIEQLFLGNIVICLDHDGLRVSKFLNDTIERRLLKEHHMRRGLDYIYDSRGVFMLEPRIGEPGSAIQFSFKGA